MIPGKRQLLNQAMVSPASSRSCWDTSFPKYKLSVQPWVSNFGTLYVRGHHIWPSYALTALSKRLRPREGRGAAWKGHTAVSESASPPWALSSPLGLGTLTCPVPEFLPSLESPKPCPSPTACLWGQVEARGSPGTQLHVPLLAPFKFFLLLQVSGIKNFSGCLDHSCIWAPVSLASRRGWGRGARLRECLPCPGLHRTPSQGPQEPCRG